MSLGVEMWSCEPRGRDTSLGVEMWSCEPRGGDWSCEPRGGDVVM